MADTSMKTVDTGEIFDRVELVEDACDNALPSRILSGKWIVIRLDGRNFSKLTRQKFKKPFDEAFRDAMVVSTAAVMKDFACKFSSTHSDEASLVISCNNDVFGRRTQKMLSVASGIMSSSFSLAIGQHVSFDARLIWFDDIDAVIDYFVTRRRSASTNALNDFAYWTLKHLNRVLFTGFSSRMKNMSSAERRTMLTSLGHDPATCIPSWASSGTNLIWERFEKQTEHGPVIRRKISIIDEQLSRDSYVEMIKKVLYEGENDEKESA